MFVEILLLCFAQSLFPQQFLKGVDRLLTNLLPLLPALPGEVALVPAPWWGCQLSGGCRGSSAGGNSPPRSRQTLSAGPVAELWWTCPGLVPRSERQTCPDDEAGLCRDREDNLLGLPGPSLEISDSAHSPVTLSNHRAPVPPPQ